MDTKHTLLCNSLKEYYANPQNMESLVEALKENSCVSLRLLDWFVTKHAKNQNIQYMWFGKNIHVYSSYRAQLKAYSKKLMDPFCRRKRFMLSQDGTQDGNHIVTTLGQMNFFRWAIENGVLSYIFDNFDALSSTMRQETKKLTKKKKTGKIFSRKNS